MFPVREASFADAFVVRRVDAALAALRFVFSIQIAHSPQCGHLYCRCVLLFFFAHECHSL